MKFKELQKRAGFFNIDRREIERNHVQFRKLLGRVTLYKVEMFDYFITLRYEGLCEDFDEVDGVDEACTAKQYFITRHVKETKTKQGSTFKLVKLEFNKTGNERIIT